MLNWIKFISVFLVILTSVIVVAVFYNANKPFSSAKAKAEDAAIESGQIATVNSVQLYNGTHSYTTVFGVNGDGEEVAVFVDQNLEKDYQQVKLADGITAEEAIKTVEDELSVDEVLHVSLGLEEEGPVWEVAFKTNDKLNYVYVFFENGQWWKRILNL